MSNVGNGCVRYDLDERLAIEDVLLALDVFIYWQTQPLSPVAGVSAFYSVNQIYRGVFGNSALSRML